MKTFSKEDLQKDAFRLMAAHGEKKIFATQDGNMFFKELDAKNHNGELKKLPGMQDLEIIPFESSTEEVKVDTVESEEQIAAKQAHDDAKTALTAAKAVLTEAKKATKTATTAAGKKDAGDDVKLAAAEAEAKVVEATTAVETAEIKVAEAKAALDALK
ncbi:MAG: hypothetical protein Q8K66_13140 [Sediminibacterium sp.]|nr:hypothetical protein [Sediminibacterium sp.]MDP3128820.1 hypothetical protein [Sediminibacterium sp.]